MKKAVIVTALVASVTFAVSSINLFAKKVAYADENIVYPQADVAIDEKNFPDEYFRKYVLNNFDQNHDGTLSEAEIAEVTRVVYEGKNVKSLKGVEFFTELKDLCCSNCQLTSLDVSKNTNLTELDCRYNQLTNLDVSKNANLTKLKCGSNQLTNLDVSKNTKLENLNCYGNQLTNLDVSNNPNLIDFDCSENQLISLDVSNNSKLENLTCLVNQLTNLDVSNNPKLRFFSCRENQLTSLDVSNNLQLKVLYCGKNKLKNIDLGQNSNLEVLGCEFNQLTSLDLSKLGYLDALVCDNNQIDKLDVSNCTELISLCKKFGVQQNITGMCQVAHEQEYLFFSVDSVVKMTPELFVPIMPNSMSVEIDLSNEGIPRNGSDDPIHAWNALWYLDMVYDLFDSYYDRGITSTDLDRDGHYDVDEFYNGDFYLKKSASCNIKDEFVFKKDQLKDTIYKEIAIVFGEHYTISFDANGGSGVMDSRRLFDGKEFVLPECEFAAPEGKEFDRWNLGDPGVSVKITADTTLKAQWKDIIYSVKVTTDGHGTALASVDNGAMGTEVTLKTQPNDGYKFKEWQVISGGVTIKDDKFVIGTENVEIKAFFEAVSSNPTPSVFPTPPAVPATPTPVGQTPTNVPTQNPTPTQQPTPAPSKGTIADFVERLYTVALGRASEKDGKEFWVKEITNGNKTGADCGLFFLTSEEFNNRGLSIENFVETLYQTFFGRASEPNGKAYWVGELKSGRKSRADVIWGFIDSKEWCNICADYGVKSGAPTAKAEHASQNAIDFATRLYTCCLGRDPEDGGLKYWSLALTNLEQTGCTAAKEFFMSQEFVNLKLKDDEYIRRLYTTFMGRDPESSEIAYWTGEIKKGTQTRYSIMQFFGQSPEFTEICKKYGIDRGTI